MARIIVPDPVEYAQIHAATCRARQQGLACSTCSELARRIPGHRREAA